MQISKVINTGILLGGENTDKKGLLSLNNVNLSINILLLKKNFTWK